MAMAADEERRMISARTKAALAGAKKRGTKLGGYREGAKLTRAARQAGRPRNKSVSAQQISFNVLAHLVEGSQPCPWPRANRPRTEFR